MRDEHAVAVHRLCQVRRWNVDVVPLPWLRRVWHDEAETGGIGVQASGDEVLRYRAARSRLPRTCAMLAPDATSRLEQRA